MFSFTSSNSAQTVEHSRSARLHRRARGLVPDRAHGSDAAGLARAPAREVVVLPPRDRARVGGALGRRRRHLRQRSIQLRLATPWKGRSLKCRRRSPASAAALA